MYLIFQMFCILYKKNIIEIQMFQIDSAQLPQSTMDNLSVPLQNLTIQGSVCLALIEITGFSKQ